MQRHNNSEMRNLHCGVCLRWHRQENIRAFPCGHVYCASCIDTLSFSGKRRFPCPECRQPSCARDGHRLWARWRDARVPRTHSPQYDPWYEPPSSSRGGTPGLEGDEELSHTRHASRTYSLAVHVQAQQAVDGIARVGNKRCSAEIVEQIALEVGKVVEVMEGGAYDKVKLLLTELPRFLDTKAAPLIAQLDERFQRSEQLLDQALDNAEKAKTMFVSLREEHDRDKQAASEKLRLVQDGAEGHFQTEKNLKLKIAELQKKLQEAEERAEKCNNCDPEQACLQDGEVDILTSGARSRTSPLPKHDDLLLHLPSQALRPGSIPWNIPPPPTVKRKRNDGPIVLDADGHPVGLVQKGPRTRMNGSN